MTDPGRAEGQGVGEVDEVGLVVRPGQAAGHRLRARQMLAGRGPAGGHGEPVAGPWKRLGSEYGWL